MVWGVSVTPRPLFTPGKEQVPIVQEAGWISGLVWTGAENLAPTVIRSPDRPARRQSLYRLRYPAHTTQNILSENFVRHTFVCFELKFTLGFRENSPFQFTVIGEVTRCNLVHSYRRFRSTCSLHLRYKFMPWVRRQHTSAKCRYLYTKYME